MEMPAPRTKAFCHSRPSYFAGSNPDTAPAIPSVLDHGPGEIEGEFRVMNSPKRVELAGSAPDSATPDLKMK
jgi:hypothetical protein